MKEVMDLKDRLIEQAEKLEKQMEEFWDGYCIWSDWANEQNSK